MNTADSLLSVETLNAEWRTRSALMAISFSSREKFHNRIAVTSSFGTESAVLLHLVAKINRHIPIFFIDTGKHFKETLEYRDTVAEFLRLDNIVILKPDPEELNFSDPNGNLYQSNPDRCCDIRKVKPLDLAIEGIDAWISGRKRYQNANREDLPIFETGRGEKIKINPLANWNERDIAGYIENNNLPEHPLVAKGFPSIGCEVCTSRVLPGEDARAGRWRGSEKTECGIHMNAEGQWVRTGNQAK